MCTNGSQNKDTCSMMTFYIREHTQKNTRTAPKHQTVKRKKEVKMQLIVIVEGGDQVHSLEVPYDADLLTVMQLIQSEVNKLYSCGVVVLWWLLRIV